MWHPNSKLILQPYGSCGSFAVSELRGYPGRRYAGRSRYEFSVRNIKPQLTGILPGQCPGLPGPRTASVVVTSYCVGKIVLRTGQQRELDKRRGVGGGVGGGGGYPHGAVHMELLGWL